LPRRRRERQITQRPGCLCHGEPDAGKGGGAAALSTRSHRSKSPQDRHPDRRARRAARKGRRSAFRR
jgi:hypothetical protein